MPSAMVKPLNVISTAKPTSACNTRKTAAETTLTWPEGIGRERVRSTLASRSRSTMSFQVQPAPRMAKAPMKNRHEVHEIGTRAHGGDRGKRRRPPARQQQKPGADRPVKPREPQVRACQAGASVSTQLPVASATEPAVRRSSRQRIAGERVEGAAVRSWCSSTVSSARCGDGVAQRRYLRTASRSFGAHDGAELQSLVVVGLRRLDRLIRRRRTRSGCRQKFHHHRSRRR